MTRINVIPPEKLTDQHLLAEYRELPRVFPLAQAAIARGIVLGPPSYTLGKGHVCFFYSRTDWLSARQGEIIRELLDRGVQVTHRDPPPPLQGCGSSGWTPDAQAVALNLARLRERLLAPPRPDFYTHRGVPVPSTFYGED